MGKSYGEVRKEIEGPKESGHITSHSRGDRGISRTGAERAGRAKAGLIHHGRALDDKQHSSTGCCVSGTASRSVV